MENRRTIFPGTAGDPAWRIPDSSPKSTLKRPNDTPTESGARVLKKQITSPLLLKSSTTVLTRTAEHSGVISKTIPSAKNRILPPTYGRLASLLPVSSESPWSKYRSILTEEQGGDTILAHSIEAGFKLFAIRCLNKNSLQKHGSNLKNANHINIVPLHHAFQHNESFYFVYSPMSVPLAALQCVAEGGFEAFEVAAVCKEVLDGINYIHTSLEISYGILESANILLDSRANIKLANIGEVMLNRAHDKQKDISDLGVLASRLSRRFIEDLDETVSDIIVVGSDIHDFITSAKSTDGAELQEHSFLKLSPGSTCLIPRMTVAERQWFRNWRLSTDNEI